jgi:hypothetical protein
MYPHASARWLTILLLYVFYLGNFLTRSIVHACYVDLSFRVLTVNQQRDDRRIRELRRRNLDCLMALFLQILRSCLMAGMVSLCRVALDSIKLQANASKYMSISPGGRSGLRGGSRMRSTPDAQGRAPRCPGRSSLLQGLPRQ